MLDDLPEANYLIRHDDGPKYRLIIRHFYERHREHASYVRSDEIIRYVRRVFPDYDDAACHRNLDQLVQWKLIRLLPEQSKPANLLELRQRPRVYQAERMALRLEEMKIALEEESARAAVLNPTALDQLVQRLKEYADWVAHRPEEPTRDDRKRTYELWDAVFQAFENFSHGVEDYLSDLPRHRPKETLDYLGFLGYREIVTRYLNDYARSLFDRREYIRHLLHGLDPVRVSLAQDAATLYAEQVLADGTTPNQEAAAARYERDMRGLSDYFADRGDVDVLLEQAQGWVAEITRHARRLSERHLGSTVREQTLLGLATRFVACRDLAAAQGLAQVAFAATLPLHWRGVALPTDDASPWDRPEVTAVKLRAVKRGNRQRAKLDNTVDRSGIAFNRMAADAAAREKRARELARLFSAENLLDLNQVHVSSEQRQQLLRLIYRAESHGGRVSLGYLDWSVSVEPPSRGLLGMVVSDDGRLLLPRYRLKLHRGRDDRD